MQVMIWLTKTLEFGNYGEGQDRYAALFMKLKGPRRMMMIASGQTEYQSVYLSLPDRTYVALFSDWSEVPEGQLPKAASALVAHQDEFEKRFSYPSDLSG